MPQHFQWHYGLPYTSIHVTLACWTTFHVDVGMPKQNASDLARIYGVVVQPSRSNIIVAIAAMDGIKFGEDKITLNNKFNNSFMQVFMTLCVRHMFIKSKVASNLERLDLPNRGVMDSYLRTSLFS